MARSVYVKICEFLAKPGYEKQFETIYGPEGDWAQIFKRSKGFLRTELNIDRDRPGRYLTADYFISLEEYDKCLNDNREAYQALDRRCEAVRASESVIGSFQNHGAFRF
jgi:hypothetical protein